MITQESRIHHLEQFMGLLIFKKIGKSFFNLSQFGGCGQLSGLGHCTLAIIRGLG